MLVTRPVFAHADVSFMGCPIGPKALVGVMVGWRFNSDEK